MTLDIDQYQVELKVNDMQPNWSYVIAQLSRIFQDIPNKLKTDRITKITIIFDVIKESF